MTHGHASSTFLEALQAQRARVAIGPFSMRGPGCGCAIREGRRLAAALDLAAFATRDPSRYAAALTRATARLVRACRPDAAYWGLARKALNIFLRDCLYTSYLRDHWHLAAAEALLELPLDALTARQLRLSDRDLPRWPTVRGLTPAVSAAYQAVAARVAAEHGIARVHLDVFWWGARTAAPAPA